MRGRFAPSPTGDLHLGSARTALCAWLAARAGGGGFVVRVEDLDAARIIPGAEARILSDLVWLGLDWDEGPDRGGPHAPYRQSERLDLYRRAADTLVAEGRAFPCWCSRAEVQRASQAPHGPSDDGPRYPGTCRTRAEAGPRAPSLRFRVDDGETVWIDGTHGHQRDRVSEQVGDFVIRRSDGVFAYQLAVVIDDAAMAIAEVVRGDDLLGSTARQILLYKALRTTPPHFIHVPLVLGPDGARLSKRHGDIGIRTLRDRGVPANAVIGRLAASLGLCRPDESVSPSLLVARWDPARLPTEPTVLDPLQM